MSIVDSLPNRPLSEENVRSLESTDAIKDIAPAAIKSSLNSESGVAEMVVTTRNVVVAIALIDDSWEILFRGAIGDDGSQEDLFNEAYDTLEDSTRTPQ